MAHIVAADDYPRSVTAVAGRFVEAADAAAMLSLLGQAVRALGAQRGFFLSLSRQQDQVTDCRLLLVCDAGWSSRYLADGLFTRDPWLGYAASRTEPMVVEPGA